jgi:N-acetylmuramoyl-L-alanine amidase
MVNVGGIMLGAVLAAAVAAVLTVAGPAAGSQTDEEAVECIATAVYYEARGEEDDGREAVAHVILNRAEHEDFPDTPCEVVGDGCEFSVRCDGRPERMADPDDRVAAFAVAEAAVEGERADPTEGALFFHARSVQLDWFETLERVGPIGGHVFYR